MVREDTIPTRETTLRRRRKLMERKLAGRQRMSSRESTIDRESTIGSGRKMRNWAQRSVSGVGRRLSERLKGRKGDRAGCIEKREQHGGWGWGNREMGLIKMHREGYSYRVEAREWGEIQEEDEHREWKGLKRKITEVSREPKTGMGGERGQTMRE